MPCSLSESGHKALYQRWRHRLCYLPHRVLTSSRLVEQKSVRAFVLEEYDVKNNLGLQEWLELALGLILDYIFHLFVAIGLNAFRYIKALIDGEYNPHALSDTSLRSLNLNIDATPVQRESQLLTEGGSAVDEFGWTEALTTGCLIKECIDSCVS